MEPFSFATSESLDYPVSIRITNLEGDEAPFQYSTLLAQPELKNIGSNTSPHSDLYVTIQVWAGSKPLTVPVQTSYKPFRNERRWHEWLSLPIKYRNLPASACLAITIWDVSPTGGKNAHGHTVPFGGTTLPLFDKDNQIQKGRQQCHVHRQKLADGNDNTTTPAFVDARKRGAKNGNGGATPLDKEFEEIDRIDALLKQREMGEIDTIDWLDRLVFRGYEKKCAQASRNSLKLLQHQEQDALNNNVAVDEKRSYSVDERPGPSKFVLVVELPMFDLPVVFADYEYPVPPISSMQHMSSSQSNLLLKPPPDLQYGPGINGGSEHGHSRIMKVYDPEVGARDNPVENKHRRLVRSQHRHGFLDKDLKPNAKVRDELNMILGYSPTHILASEEKDLIWKFRYHLTKDKRALTKFVKSVNWDDPVESRLAVTMLSKWTAVEVADALELLGPTFTNSDVRKFAVERLRKADDDELLLYLLQLVQALKFEHINAESNQEGTHDSSLVMLLIQRAAKNFMLGNSFYWYLMVEIGDGSTEETEYIRIYKKVAFDFMSELEKLEGGAETRVILRRQAELILLLGKISEQVKNPKLSMSKKVEEVKKFLADPSNELSTIEPPLPLPLDPSVKITGVSTGPDETHVFKSSLCPIKLTFKTTTSKKYPIIFKTGDDLRQDQLVIQIITLMDQLLQKENLDLKLSPYKILATSPTAGASQFVNSKPLQAIVNKYPNGALDYLKDNNPDPHGPLGMRREALDTFVRSCAGYSVITYILGVGDRHLDNLLLAPDGHFFHADFGFILGRDPKPLAPPVKVSKEMVNAMGGPGSSHYKQFKQFCFLAYAALRKSANLLLNLFSLMVDADIPDIKLEPDKAVLKVKERLVLELDEEDAMLHWERVMEASMNAFAPVFIDAVHDFMQRVRT